mmetsp:Transcript_3427/g.5139  ORF Transcript_3427/g.5139 Transcript_3427/m.5139 type:complete len:262 (+) Transcript_3427:122-907(+)
MNPIVAFVIEYHPYYTTYLKDHFNLSHPQIVKALNYFSSSRLFLNGGVFVMDAIRWRENNFTAKCEQFIIENHHKIYQISHNHNESYSNNSKMNAYHTYSSSIYDTRVGDQAVFYALLFDAMGCLPAQYNMRRLPKKTIHMLEANFLGIVHLAGSTGGNAEILCDNPLQYPIFLPAVLPLYLSTVASYMRYIMHRTTAGTSPFLPNISEADIMRVKYRFSNSCNEAVEIVAKELASKSLSVRYNAGKGRFSWPPLPYRHQE